LCDFSSNEEVVGGAFVFSPAPEALNRFSPSNLILCFWQFTKIKLCHLIFHIILFLLFIQMHTRKILPHF